MTTDYRNRIKEYRTVASSDLTRNPLNFRRHPETQRQALRGLLTSVGRVAPLLAYEDAGGALVCLDGHARLDESDEWDVAILDIDEAEAATVLAMLDKIGADAEIDPQALMALLDTLDTEARQTAGAAWSDDELAALIDGATKLPEAGGGGDEFDPTPEDGPTRTALGELWMIGGVHRLYVGDCTDAANVARLMQGERADQMITDPPYGVDYSDKNDFLNAYDKGNHIQSDIENDAIADYLIFFTDFLKAAQMADYNTVYVFMSPKEYPTLRLAATNAGYKWSVDLVWNKNNHVLTRQDYFGKHEMIFYGWIGKHRFYGDKGVSVLEYSRPTLSDMHPTTKPLDLIERLMTDGSDRDAIAYDPFLGSGTTLIAAHRTGRRCYGMEIAPRYADVILRRAEAEGLTVERADH